ncbi:MAG: hypothetical protein AABY22_29555 [Nanoarchaeota archaeon]
MIKTELEGLFEDGFRKFGGLSRRIYYDEIVEQAKLEDDMADESLTQDKEEFREITGEDPSLRDLFALYLVRGLQGNVTPEQHMVAYDAIPFFRRRSATVNGLFFDYDVHSSEKLEKYREAADELVREGKISEQYIYIYPQGAPAGLDLVSIEINVSTKNPNTIHSLYVQQNIVEFFSKQGKEPNSKLRIIRSIEGVFFEPQKLYDFIMRFILD